MALSSAAIDTMQRLVDQVQALSSVAETLTLRLLELEERLQRHERAISEPATLDLGALAERRLAESEQRLQGLEQMLASLPLAQGAEVVDPALPADPGDQPQAGGGEPKSLSASVERALEAVDPVVAEPEALEPLLRSTATEGADPALAEEEEGWQVEEDWSPSARLSA